MITGNEPLHASHEAYAEKHVEEDARNHTSGGGITLKQHMVIEFTKAFLTFDGECTNETLRQNSEWAIRQANEVIKQLNEDDKRKTDNTQDN